MVRSTNRQRIKTLLTETITRLCVEGLKFKSEISVEALIGITLDQEDVFLISIKETIRPAAVTHRTDSSSRLRQLFKPRDCCVQEHEMCAADSFHANSEHSSKYLVSQRSNSPLSSFKRKQIISVSPPKDIPACADDSQSIERMPVSTDKAISLASDIKRNVFACSKQHQPLLESTCLKGIKIIKSRHAHSFTDEEANDSNAVVTMAGDFSPNSCDGDLTRGVTIKSESLSEQEFDETENAMENAVSDNRQQACMTIDDQSDAIRDCSGWKVNSDNLESLFRINLHQQV